MQIEIPLNSTFFWKILQKDKISWGKNSFENSESYYNQKALALPT